MHNAVVRYGSETLLFKENHVIRLEGNDARMVRWISNVISENRISAVELSNRLEVNIMRECLQNKILLWFDNLKKNGTEFPA